MCNTLTIELTISVCFVPAQSNTVEPVYNGDPWDLRNWLVNTGSLKILTGRGLMM